MTFREFTGKSVEEAVRAAMAEFHADLGDLDVEILSAGSRGILGVGGEEARILAAPKTAVAAAGSVKASAAAPEPSAPPARGGRTSRSAAPVAESEPEPEPVEAMESVSADIEEPPLAATMATDSRPPRDGRGRSSRGRSGSSRRTDDRPPSSRGPRPPREVAEPRPFVPAKPLDEMTPEEQALMQEGKAVLEEMLRLMELSGTVEIASGQESAKLNVKGEDLGVLIGRRGEKLASLQHIVNLIASRKDGPSMRIMVDVENYRGRREDQLRDVATRAAQRVIQTGKIIQLEAMPAVERRIVHMALVENPKVRTQSVGVDPNRRIVILPASQAE
jgi:spoIIIJ-associated protein